jgi:hypothetical protein
VIPLHGTTRKRAEEIKLRGPDLHYQEAGAASADSSFSMCLASGPFLFGKPEEYAHGKSKEFPEKGGPAILEVEVPEAIVERAMTAWFPLSQGLVQFDEGAGWEELIAAWPTLVKEVRSVP